MSRLLIKNLPVYVTPERLRTHFSQESGPGGAITDVQVALRPNGTSRRFGFIGYKTEKDAQTARDWFDRTFIDSTRISVTIVEGARDSPVLRPSKRRRLDPSPAESVSPANTKSKDANMGENRTAEKGPKFAEFMRIMQSRSKRGPSWANEVEPAENSRAVESLDPSIPELDKIEGEQSMKETAPTRADDISDLDWMKQRMSANVGAANGGKAHVFEQSDDEDSGQVSSHPMPDATNPAPDTATETILNTARLFLRNLAFSCADADLKDLFAPYGDIQQVHIPLDPHTKQTKGLAYVTFVKPACALAAYQSLDKKSFQGRLLHILPAVEKNGQPRPEEGEGKKKTVKAERQERNRANAGKGFNWAMLYMNSDAVLSSVADRMNISKAEILNPESGGAAIKLALAETHVINETKAYLESQGILLSAFASRARSETTILVKNIPYGTSAEQIRELFESHGDLDRVVVPPAGTMAVVEFVKADDAKRAFRAIAYRRMGNSVIYLEKGPIGMFEQAEESKDAEGPRVSTGVAPITISEPAGEDEQADGLAEGTTLFVKNLSFSTTTDRLRQVFGTLSGFSFARVQTKPDPKHLEAEARRLSMGYGFVGFKTVDAAKKALKGLNGYVLDGHALHVKFAGRGREGERQDEQKTATKSRTSKMIVKNVPFEATRKDIRELFGSHGHLKSVRLPKKFNSKSRGFAFLEFTSRTEAENAFNALQHTHLLGRHLVLEWAEESEQDLDALRRKAGVGLGHGGALPGRKRKLAMGDGDGYDHDEDS